MDDLTKKKRVRAGHRESAKLVTKMEETVASANSESTEKDLMALRQEQIALKDKITLLKQLDIECQIIDVISDSKDEDVGNQVCKEIEESDEIIAEFEKTHSYTN